jgi:DNA polymerase-3 subunit delta
VTPKQLRAKLAKSKSSSRTGDAWLVVGEEPLMRDDAVSALRIAVLGEGPNDFDLDRLEGDATTAPALIDAVRTLPVLADRRLVILREPEPRRGAGTALTDAIAEAVKEVTAAEGTVLVVVATKADGRSRWVKSFGDAVVRCDPPRRGRDLTAFVEEEAASQDVRLESGAAALLAERTGPQLLMLRQEIAKAALLAGPGEPVTRAHVLSGSCDLAEEPVWDLTDAIGEGRVADSLGLLAKLLGSGAAPPALLGVLVSHFRKLLRIGSGGSVPGPPFVQRKLESQARRYTRARLLACLRAIHETDTALKGLGVLRPETALERLVIGLAS